MCYNYVAVVPNADVHVLVFLVVNDRLKRVTSSALQLDIQLTEWAT